MCAVRAPRLFSFSLRMAVGRKGKVPVIPHRRNAALHTASDPGLETGPFRARARARRCWIVAAAAVLQALAYRYRLLTASDADAFADRTVP